MHSSPDRAEFRDRHPVECSVPSLEGCARTRPALRASSQVTQVLAPDALSVVARLAPGAPLCRLHAAGSPLDGLEVALEGGQIGDANYFIKARDGVQSRR